MNKKIEISGKTVDLEISKSGVKALESRSSNLVAEMELYFSCLIRKQVRFREETDDRCVEVMDKLYVRFRPVMTESCTVKADDAPPVTDFPIANEKPYIPKWLKLDYSSDGWKGEFGF